MRGSDRFRSRAGAAVLVALSSFALLATSMAHAREIEGVEFPERIEVGDTPLNLNAVGLLRYMYVFKAYVAGLYLGPDVRPSQILDDTPKRLAITYFYPIAREDFVSSTAEAIRKNVGNAGFEALAESIASFNALYKSVEPGDRYELTYLPGTGTELSLNGTALGTIEGAEFARAVFSIWFGDAAIDGDLKKRLLSSS